MPSTYTRMWSTGLTRVAAATSGKGEVTVALFAGSETQTEPLAVLPGFGGGTGPGAGNGATPVVGPWASASVTGGQLSCWAGGGVLGDDPEPDDGVEGEPVLFIVPPPQPLHISSASSSEAK